MALFKGLKGSAERKRLRNTALGPSPWLSKSKVGSHYAIIVKLTKVKLGQVSLSKEGLS